MDLYYANIESETIYNDAYRAVQYTDENIQIVYMSLLPGQEIGNEMHEGITQFFRVEAGEGVFVIGGVHRKIFNGVAFAIPPFTYHNVINTSKTESLKLYTIYSPPHHPPNTYEYNKDI